MYDNQKRFIPHLAIETELFHSAFVNPCMMENQRPSQSGVRLTAHLAIEFIMGITVRDGALALKGSHLMGDEQIFLKTLRHASFNKDQWHEPSRIHLAGRYL
jgi:hypothetical protein